MTGRTAAICMGGGPNQVGDVSGGILPATGTQASFCMAAGFELAFVT